MEVMEVNRTHFIYYYNLMITHDKDIDHKHEIQRVNYILDWLY